MSSHHFVKEGQEPALLIMDGASFETVAGLLEWAPLVMVMDNALDQVLTWGIKIDIVFGTTSAESDLKDKLIDQMPVKIFTAEDEPINLVMPLVNAQRQHELSIVTHDRYADRARQIFSPWMASARIVIFTESRKWMYIADGNFQKWFAAGSSLITDHAVDARVENIALSGMKGTVTADGPVRIEAPRPFWIAEVF